MADTKHTPGPWHMGIKQPTSDKFIYGPKGEEIADCDMLLNFPDENLANARLIAAAPETAAERDRLKAINAELLEALENIEIWMTQDGIIDRMGYDCELSSVRAAIAKAKGGAA